jgi:glycine/D-amino acid oxidase-like deaminating enzyme
MVDADIAIIGGGLIGCASASYLAKAGAQVVLLERGQINQGASGQNAGSLHFQLEHRLIQDVALRTRELEYHVGLAKIAIDQWRGIDRELGCDTELSMSGGLMVAETAEQTALLERKSRIEQSQGLGVELLDGNAARKLAPYLSDRVLAALYCASEGHCNPRLLTPAYARKAMESGASIITGALVSAVHRDSDRWQITIMNDARSHEDEKIRCNVILNTAGICAAEVGSMANLHLPLFPVALTMNATEKTDPVVPHLVQHVGRKLSLKQTRDGNLLIGGGWEARLRQNDGHSTNLQSPGIDLRSVLGNLRTAADVVPLIKSLRLLRTWTGTTANTTDQLPVLGEAAEVPGYFVAAGGPGFTYGPTYARLMSEKILTGSTSYPLDPFSPARFEGRNSVTGWR